jgi:hypothetical protein
MSLPPEQLPPEQLPPEQAEQRPEPYPSYLPPAAPSPKRKAPVALWVGIAALLVVSLGVGSWLLAGNNRVVAGQPVTPGGTVSGGTVSGGKVSGGKVITATDNKSQLTVPDTWSPPPAKYKNDVAVIQMGEARRERYVMVISNAKADVADLAAFEQVVLGNSKEMLRDAAVGERRTLTIGELPAVQYVVTGTIEGIKVVYWFTLVDGKNGWYQVIGWTLPSRRDVAEKPIGEVINSFRELNTQP